MYHIGGGGTWIPLVVCRKWLELAHWPIGPLGEVTHLPLFFRKVYCKWYMVVGSSNRQEVPVPVTPALTFDHFSVQFRLPSFLHRFCLETPKLS